MVDNAMRVVQKLCRRCCLEQREAVQMEHISPAGAQLFMGTIRYSGLFIGAITVLDREPRGPEIYTPQRRFERPRQRSVGQY